MVAPLRGCALAAVVWPVLAVVSFLSAAAVDSFDDEGGLL